MQEEITIGNYKYGACVRLQKTDRKSEMTIRRHDNVPGERTGNGRTAEITTHVVDYVW